MIINITHILSLVYSSNNYVIFNETDGQNIPKSQNLNKRVTDINNGIFYKCKNQSDADECRHSIDDFMFHFV